MKFAVKSFKTRPNTPYGGETSRYSLLQGGVTLDTYLLCCSARDSFSCDEYGKQWNISRKGGK